MGKDKIIAIHSWQTDMLQDLSCRWMKIVPAGVQSYGYQVFPLFGPQASKIYNNSFSSTLADPDAVLITGLAHGTADEFTGFKGEVLFSPPVDPKQANDKIVHLLSCSTAQQLADAFKKAGCRAFIGYTDAVNIDTNDSWVQTFLTCDTQIEVSLAQGKTVGVAIQDAKNAFIKYGMSDKASLLYTDPSSSGVTLPGVKLDTTARTLTSRATQSRSLPTPNSLSTPNSLPTPNSIFSNALP